jgi:hypothetical protein
MNEKREPGITRQVDLVGGPWCGGLVFVSHWVAKVGGEIYVWDGGSTRNRFVHAATFLRLIPAEQRERERAEVAHWTENPSMRPKPAHIPDWRIWAWIEVNRYDVKI